jgi:4-hydroxy-tetrahydrodipicolinate synthase
MFEGTFTALVTPFRGGKVDVPALEALVERQIEAGVTGLVPCGSTGESATLSYDEHHRVIDVVIASAAGRVQVLAGTGSNSTREAIDFTQHAKDAGADGALLLSPYYNKPTQEGIVAHYEAIADATRFPLMVYNIPGRTASNIAPDTLARLSHHPHIVGVKESCGDIDQIAHVVARCEEGFTILSGDDALVLPLMAVGGHGAISTTSNVIPGPVCELVNAMRAGDLARGRELHFQLLPLFDILFCETNPIPVKAALALMGLVGDEIRLPLTPITAQNRERVQSALKEMGIL